MWKECGWFAHIGAIGKLYKYPLFMIIKICSAIALTCCHLSVMGDGLLSPLTQSHFPEIANLDSLSLDTV